MFYDDERGEWAFVHELIYDDYCDWYVDKEGLLYIVPPYDTTYENEGPDNEIMERLNFICRYYFRNPYQSEAHELGLTYVPHNLRRFNEVDGYYHA